MDVVVQAYRFIRLRTLHIGIEYFRHAVDDNRSEVGKRVVILLRIEAAPVQQHVHHCAGLTIFPEILIIIHLLRRDVVNHQLEHLDSVVSQLVLFLRLQHLPEQIRITHVVPALFVHFDTLDILELV